MEPSNYRLLTQDQRKAVRLQYIEHQNNLCWYCHYHLQGHPPPEVLDKPINRSLFPKGFFKNPVHLHHSHKTGLTIGAVHAYCNAVLWQYHGQ